MSGKAEQSVKGVSSSGSGGKVSKRDKAPQREARKELARNGQEVQKSPNSEPKVPKSPIKELKVPQSFPERKSASKSPALRQSVSRSLNVSQDPESVQEVFSQIAVEQGSEPQLQVKSKGPFAEGEGSSGQNP